MKNFFRRVSDSPASLAILPVSICVGLLVFLTSCGSPTQMKESTDEHNTNNSEYFTTVQVPYKDGTVDCIVYSLGFDNSLLSCDWEGYHKTNP